MSDITSLMSNFSAADYNEPAEYDNSPLPDGDYYLEVENAVVKETSNGKGVGCNVTFAVLGKVEDNSHKGRKVFCWFTLQHENEVAQDIGQKQFHQLRIAVGKPDLNDTDELIGANIVGSIGLDKKDATRNQIKRYKALEGYKAPAAAATPAAAPVAAAAPAKKKNPWD